ncbi:MAG: TolC family protein [Bacteriovoracaceae bacterium]|nr:TolC family protein [Bacteriovoracaceae bacterium]
MEKALLIFLLVGSSIVYAQDEDLSALETAIQQDVTESSTPTRTNSRWTKKRSNQVLEKETEGRAIDLRSVLEEGFRRNPFEQIRGQQKEQIELLKTDLFQKFWLPTVSLELDTSNQRIDRFRESSQSTPGMGAQKAPTGSLGLVIDEYTLFNWGRDYLQYQNDKQTLNRANQQLAEARRRLKFDLITQYFNLIRTREIKGIRQEQLRQTSFIHRLAREKLQLRKIRAQEYYQTRSEYLRSQTEYQESLYDVGLQEETLANLLGDEWRGNYRTNEELKYVSVNTSMSEAMKLAEEQSVDFRNAKLQYDNASRTYERTLKDNLPLPKFSFNLGTYRTGFDPEGTSWNYQTTPGNRNIELVAAIDMKWTLLGEGGFFNSRDNQQSYLNKRIAEINYFNTKRLLEVKIRTIYKTLRYLEQKVEIAQYQHKNAQSNYDSVLDNYIAGKTTYSDIKLAIDNLVISQMNSENVKFEHLLKKLELADYMGLEDFPGENFEQLAQR